MDTGHGEQKCACNLHQEESGSDFYRGCAENISGYRKCTGKWEQLRPRLLGRQDPASLCTKKASSLRCERIQGTLSRCCPVDLFREGICLHLSPLQRKADNNDLSIGLCDCI